MYSSTTHSFRRELEQALPAQFHRIHHWYIVNLTQIHKIGDNHVHVGAARLPISDSYRPAFLRSVEAPIQ